MASSHPKGRTQHLASRAGQQHKASASSVLKAAVRDFRSQSMEFRVFTRELGGGGLVPLDPFVESLQWGDDPDSGGDESSGTGAMTTGSISLRSPLDPLDPETIPVRNGSVIVLKVKIGSSTYQLWSLRAGGYEWDDETGTLSMTLGDEMESLKRSKISVVLRAGRNHGKRFRTGEIIRTVLKKINVAHGDIIKGSAEGAVKNFVHRNSTAYDMIMDQIERELRVRSGLRLRVMFTNGKFEVKPFSINPLLYEIEDALTSAHWQERWRSGDGKFPYTVVEGRARVGKGKHAKVHQVNYPTSPKKDEKELLRLFGKRVKKRTYHPVDSKSELKTKVKRTYAHLASPVRSAEVSVTPGIPFVRHGDMIHVKVPKHGYEGSQALVLVNTTSHTLQGGVLTTDLTVQQKNPYRQYKKDREKAVREDKRKKRRKK